METLTIIRSSGSGPVTYTLEASLWVPKRRSDVFDFFSKAENLGALTPPSLGFRILTPLPIAMSEGALIDYRISLRGLPFRWRTLISAWEPPSRFVDEQVKGPYRSWIHEHRFSVERGGTRIEDRIEYRVLGGAWVHDLFVRRELRKIFGYRSAVVRKQFGSSETNESGQGRASPETPVAPRP